MRLRKALINKDVGERIKLLCSWADEHEVDPDKAIEFVRLVYSVFTKRADVTPEQRRDEMHRMLKLVKPA